MFTCTNTIPRASKFFGRILIDRLITEVDEKLRPEQAGFRKGRSTTEQTFIIIEQSAGWQANFYVNFVDVQKTFLLLFDNFIREIIWKILRSYDIPETFVRIIRNLYNNSESTVIYEESVPCRLV